MSSPTKQTRPSITVKAKSTPYICALCSKGFTRKSTVKDPHFPSCVRKNGNPDNIAWDDHPSCYTKFPDGSLGPSNTRPAGLHIDIKRELDDTPEDFDYTRGAESNDHLEERNIMDGENLDEHKLVKGEGGWKGAESSYTGFLTEANGKPYLAPSSHGFAEHVQERTGVPMRSLPLAAAYDHQYADLRLLRPLSGMEMNQIANVAISVSRERADQGYRRSLEVWVLWYNLLPQGTITKVKPPDSRSKPIQRRQAVVWLAQDVYAAELKRMRTLEDQSRLILIWRNIMTTLECERGMNRINELLSKAAGQVA